MDNKYLYQLELNNGNHFQVTSSASNIDEFLLINSMGGGWIISDDKLVAYKMSNVVSVHLLGREG